MKQLLDIVCSQLEKNPFNFTVFEDLYKLTKETMKSDPKLAVPYGVKLAAECEKRIMDESLTDQQVFDLFNLHEKILLVLAPHHFESYLLYMEWDREPSKKFYPPRRKRLKEVVDALQELADGELDLLAISMPPGTGKTTLAIFFLTWLAGKRPNEPKLTGSHSNSFIRGVYDECLRMLDKNGEYRWYDVFPTMEVSKTNAKDCRIDVDKQQRFETLEFTSIGTGNAGLYRAADLLYCDDLVSGIEVALSKERLDKLWQTYTTDLRQRKIGDHCRELHIATRWSVHDVIGRLEAQYAGNPRAKFIVIPAMDENDESNFDYDYGVGFSTQVYREQRDIMDEVSWKALYQNEPVEREGLLYHPDELRRYYDLPTEEPDTIVGVCDTKNEGKDFCVLPVFYVYGNDYYLVDVICDNGLSDTVDSRLTDILYRHKVRMCRFESNSAGGRIAKDVQEALKAKNGVTHITTKYSSSHKETRIIVAAAWVKEHCLFKDASMYRKKSDYGVFMDFVTTYTVVGKNKHDDTVDALAMMSDFAISLMGNKVEVIQRPW